jgi:hypothetical protein
MVMYYFFFILLGYVNLLFINSFLELTFFEHNCEIPLESTNFFQNITLCVAHLKMDIFIYESILFNFFSQ